MRKVLYLMLCVTLVAGLAHSQGATTGSLSGTVTDPNGDPMPGVTVTATLITTGTRYSTVTDASGIFRMSNVKVYNCFTGGKQVNFQKNIQSSWMDYTIDAPATGTYELTIRHAVVNREQVLNVRIGDRKPITINIPNTWGLWKTSSPVDVRLNKGPQTLRISTPYQRGVAIRWIELKS